MVLKPSEPGTGTAHGHGHGMMNAYFGAFCASGAPTSFFECGLPM